MSMSISKIKSQGAVFTPSAIVLEMLESIPHRFWSTPDIHWLEPSVGTGNFLEEIVKRIPSSHSVCAYEIDPEFCSECEERTGVRPLCEDFLESVHTERYDIIIGNPPYQKPNKKNGKARGGRSQLYLDFVDKCLSLLKPDGVLVFIHPRNWRKPNNQHLKLFLSTYNLQTLVLSKHKIFPTVSVVVDWYCVQNKPYQGQTIINGHPIRIDPDIPFLPNRYDEFIQQTLLEMLEGTRKECIISCDLHAYTKKHLLNKTQTDEFKFPVFNTTSNPRLWSKRPHKDQYVSKVIMSNSGKLCPFYDPGEYGVTQNSMFIRVNDKYEGHRVIDVLTKYKPLLNLCQWGMFRTEKNLISLIGF